MLYTVAPQNCIDYVLSDAQACAHRGDKVWKHLSVAREWRNSHKPKYGIYAVLADWSDVEDVEDESYGKLTEAFKLLRLESVYPKWLCEVSEKVADDAWESGILDEGYISPDYTTPEQQDVYYSKHKDETKFMLRCMISMELFEALEKIGMLPNKENFNATASSDVKTDADGRRTEGD